MTFDVRRKLWFILVLSLPTYQSLSLKLEIELGLLSLSLAAVEVKVPQPRLALWFLKMYVNIFDPCSKSFLSGESQGTSLGTTGCCSLQLLSSCSFSLSALT